MSKVIWVFAAVAMQIQREMRLGIMILENGSRKRMREGMSGWVVSVFLSCLPVFLCCRRLSGREER